MRRIMFLTTASAIVALSTGISLARAAEGEGHRDEHGPPRVEERHDVHVDPHSVVRGDHRGVVRVPPREIPHEGGVSIFGGKEHRPDGWRYRYENGAWWYWQPNNHWTYYDNGAWQDYAVETPVVPARRARGPCAGGNSASAGGHRARGPRAVGSKLLLVQQSMVVLE